MWLKKSEETKKKFFLDWPFFRSPTVDLPLHQDVSARFVPWMVGVMLYIALLFGVVSSLLFQGGHRQFDHHAPHLTLEIPVSESQREAALTQIIRVLHAMPETERVQIVSPEEVKQSFIDFFEDSVTTLGDGAYEPLLVDIWVNGPSLTSAKQIAEKMRTLHPEVQVLVHQPWMEPLIAWVSWMKWGFLCVALFFVLSICMVVTFAVRTGVSIHQPILEILDLMGASRHYITRQFQIQNRKNILKSLSIALSFLLMSCLGLLFFLENSDSLDLLISLPVLKMYALLLFFLIGGVCLLMWGTTRWVVGRALERSFVC